MKKSGYCLFFGSFLFLVGVSGAAYSNGLRDGRWDLTAQVNTMGLPIKIPEQKTTMCVDSKSEESGKPPIAAPKTCEFTDYAVKGNQASWKMTCSGSLNLEGMGSLEFTDDDYHGSSVVEVKLPGFGKIKTNQTYQGHRIGDC